jgi:hypothetical protein
MSPERLRRLAAVCRDLHGKAVVPEVKEQLGIWAVEFEAEADEGDLQSDVSRQREHNS